MGYDTEKQAAAQAELEQQQALNATMLSQHRESVVKLINTMTHYGKQFANQHQNLTNVATAIERLEKLTSGQLAEIATTARQTISEASQAAEREIVATRKRTRRALLGLDTQITEHPLLLLLLRIVRILGGLKPSPLGDDFSMCAVSRRSCKLRRHEGLPARRAHDVRDTSASGLGHQVP